MNRCDNCNCKNDVNQHGTRHLCNDCCTYFGENAKNETGYLYVLDEVW